MRKFFLVCALLLTIGIPEARAQGTITTTTCTSTNQAGCVDINVKGQGSIGITISGTWSGTITFQASVNGTNFNSLLVYPSSSTTGVTTTTGNGNWSATIGGYTVVRVVFTSWSSGTATVVRSTASARGPSPAGGGGGGSGTVTSVGLSGPDIFTYGSPVTDSGDLTFTPTDPGADRIVFWDDSAGKLQYLTAGTGLDITGTTLTATGSGGAPTDATYITQTANGSLSNEQALSSLSSGIMRVATTTGVVTSLTDSAGIAANISDETGSGALVFGTSPTIATPTISGAITFPDNTRQTFNPGTNTPGINVGAFAGDPDTPSNGDIWYDSTNNTLDARINGSNVSLTSGGGGAPTDATYITQTANGSLDNEQALAALASGLMYTTTTTGVVTSIATTINTDPGADRLGFWDESANSFDWLELGSNLSITGTTLNASGGSAGTCQETDDGTIASGAECDYVINANYAFSGSAWNRVTFGTAGTASTQVTTVQGIASMTPLQVQSNSANLATQTSMAAAAASLAILDDAVSGSGINISQIGGVAPTADLTFDFDSGGGTQTRSAIGLAFAASGGGVLAPGTTADGLLVNLGTNNDVILNSNSGVDIGDVTLTAGTNFVGEAGLATTAVTTNAASTCYITSAASTNATNCKNAAGNVYGIRAVNTTSTIYYLRMYNLSSSPTCSSATGFIETIPIPQATGAGAGIAFPNAAPQGYGTGIGFCLTGGGSSTDNTNAATGVYVTILYK